LKETGKRVLFGLIAAPIFLAVLWLGDWYLNILVLIIVGLMQRELANIFFIADAKVDLSWAFLFAFLILFQTKIPLFFPVVLFLVILYVGLKALQPDRLQFRDTLPTLFTSLYVPSLMVTILFLRETGSTETGFIVLSLIVLMVWGNDTLAYFGGRALGKHLLAPKISPKKTVEGFLFGFLGAAMVYTAYTLWVPGASFLEQISLWPIVVMASVFGPIGDLTESRLKRFVDVKDSSNLLPGHGGFLDRFDALMIVAPICWIYLEFLLYFGLVTF
jgi:phosphatidate cytidylyltransferase